MKLSAFFNSKAPKTTILCDCKGCKEAGVCKAPKDKSLKEYYHFCPVHAKQYNEAWDYYKDMTPAEIENEIRNDIGWGRPTWTFSGNGRIYDPLGLLKQGGISPDRVAPKATKEEEAALKVLGLSYPATKAKIKSRYRILAKKYHPDKTGGDKQMELIFKKISAAYMYLIKNCP